MNVFQVALISDSMRTYHIRALLSRSGSILYFLLPSTRKELTTFGADLMKHIASVPGIEDLVVEKYSFRITKAQAFTWDEVSESIESILNTD